MPDNKVGLLLSCLPYYCRQGGISGIGWNALFLWGISPRLWRGEVVWKLDILWRGRSYELGSLGYSHELDRWKQNTTKANWTEV